MKFLSATCLLVAAPALICQAQAVSTVSGRVLDEHAQPLPYATVVLQPTQDTTRTTVELTRADGSYVFAGVAPGQYRVTVSMLGYQRLRPAPFGVSGTGTAVQLPVVQLVPAARQLQGVEVVGQKPLVEMQAGKMVVNVAGSPAAAGFTALEALQKVPGLVVLNNRLSLAGREGVIVLLDGRTTQYTDVVSVLRDFPSSTIDRIEVITQPGASYDAAGSAGIINIILKQNADQGTNGSIALNGGYGRYGKGGATLDLNHRARGLNVFGNYAYTYRRTYELLNTDRVVDQAGAQISYHQQSTQPRTSQVHTARLGADYRLSPRQTLGVLLNGYTTRTTVHALNRIEVDDVVDRQNTTRNDSRRPTDSYAANANYKLALDSAGRELTLDADYSHYQTGNDSRLSNTLLVTDEPVEQLLRFQQHTTIELRSAKADYRQPLGAHAKLAAGAKASHASIDSRLDFAHFEPAAWVPEPGRSDHFRYQERITAGYLSLDQQLPAGLQLQAGLRAEQTHSVAASVAQQQTVRRDYLQLFPSLSVDKPLTKQLGASLSYGRRIDRPSYQDLNPSIVYLDPYTQQWGNPFLKPELTTAYKAAVTYAKQPVLLFFYSRTRNAISLVTAQQDSVLYSTSANLDRLDNYSTTLNFPLSLGKRVRGYGGTTVFYNHYRSAYLSGQYRNGQLSGMLYLQSKVSLPHDVALEISGFAHSAGVNGLINFRPFGYLNLGLQKSLWHDQALLRVAVSDVLFTNKQRGTVRYQDMDIRFLTLTESRQVRVSFSCKFGNQQLLAARKRTTGLDEERGRVKSDKE